MLGGELLVFLPNKNEIRRALIRNFLQKYVLKIGMNEKISSLSQSLRPDIVENDTEVFADLGEVSMSILLYHFDNAIRRGREFPFVLAGQGQGKIKIKSTVLIFAKIAEVSNGALKVSVDNRGILLKFNSKNKIRGLLTRFGACVLYCEALSKYIVLIPTIKTCD